MNTVLKMPALLGVLKSFYLPLRQYSYDSLTSYLACKTLMFVRVTCKA